MGERTSISWTDATWNPWWGCTQVGPGCDGCYAAAFAKRFGVLWGNEHPRRYAKDSYWNEPLKWDRKAADRHMRLRVFCASMADVFDNQVEQKWRERLWTLIRQTPNLDWQIVTKRIGNAEKMLPADWGDGYPNVWMIPTVVNQAEGDRDIPKLLSLPARVRGLSIEPMLEYIDLTDLRPHGRSDDTWINALAGQCGLGNLREECGTVDWVIVGGESRQAGHEPRPFDLAGARRMRDQCADHGVAFHLKQLGSLYAERHGLKSIPGKDPTEWPDDLDVREFPEASAT